jgi:predicted flap endonuclease-1-like 5' DNA nuclease
MPFTKFPLETDEPQIDVILPVGTHVFKLTVIDDAGMRSHPDIIVIRVEARNPPDISNVAPDAARQGSTVSAIVYGQHLDGITATAAYLESHQDERIRVTLQPGGTPERLPIRIDIMEHARPGLRTLEVITPNGIATADFTVLPTTRPEPKNILPASGRLGNTRPYEVTVTGANLKRAEAVTFLLRGRPDTQLRSTITLASPEALTLAVSTSANAEFGGRQVQVATSSSTGVSPADVEFSVVPGPLQVVIVLLGLAAILLHLLLGLPPQLSVPVGLVYVVLLAAMYLPLPGLSSARPWLRWVLLVFAVMNAIGWIIQISQPSLIRFAAPLVEIGLTILVFLESQQPQWKDRLPPAAEISAPVVESTPAAEAEVPAAKISAPAVESAPDTGEGAAAGATGAGADEAAPTVAAADAAARLKQLEAILSTPDVANLREKVEFIEGIGAAYAAKLNQAGVVTVMDLLRRGATRKGRAELAESTGLDAGLILTWINHADLFRIKGVGKQFGELLEAAGVDTVVELAQRNPANLFSKLAQVNAEKKLTGRSPRQDEVNNWVQQAKSLSRVVEY